MGCAGSRSGYDFTLEADFFFASRKDFDFAFKVGLGAGGVANILSSCCLDI